MNKTLNKLCDWFLDKKSVIIALSGGVDSALVAFAAFQTLKSNAIAVTADYKTLSKEELNSAKKISNEIKIKQIIIRYNELENDAFVANDNKRCFYCRTELAQHLVVVAKKYNVKTIVDGTNPDDLGDYRPGIQALRKAKIQSPLLELGIIKNEIREIAKNVGLSVYDKPSNSCLASRIPWGQRIDAQRLARIEVGEKIVKQIVTANQVRVRDFNGNARIDIGSEDLHLLNIDNKYAITKKLEMLGFDSVNFNSKGYKSGSVNVI